MGLVRRRCNNNIAMSWQVDDRLCPKTAIDGNQSFEADVRMLEYPVMVTRFAGMEEQFQRGVNGLIVEQDGDSLRDGLSSVIRDVRARRAQGGYPQELLDDDAKMDLLMELISGASAQPTTDIR